MSELRTGQVLSNQCSPLKTAIAFTCEMQAGMHCCFVHVRLCGIGACCLRCALMNLHSGNSNLWGKDLRGRELHPGLPRDRRKYRPLYYHGFDTGAAPKTKHASPICQSKCLDKNGCSRHVWSSTTHTAIAKSDRPFASRIPCFFCFFRFPRAELGLGLLATNIHALLPIPEVGLEPTISSLGGRRLIH